MHVLFINDQPDFFPFINDLSIILFDGCQSLRKLSDLGNLEKPDAPTLSYNYGESQKIENSHFLLALFNVAQETSCISYDVIKKFKNAF